MALLTPILFLKHHYPHAVAMGPVITVSTIGTRLDEQWLNHWLTWQALTAAEVSIMQRFMCGRELSTPGGTCSSSYPKDMVKGFGC